ncbi:MAG: hypothetical protein AAGH83_02120 [Pseudomonadota bacterium]
MAVLRIHDLTLASLMALGLAAWSVQAGAVDSIMRSTVEITPTDEPGAVAEIHFHNTGTHMRGDNGRYTVERDGLSVDIEFTWNAVGQSDRIRIFPPDGYVALPPQLIPGEYESGVSLLYPLQPPGM